MDLMYSGIWWVLFIGGLASILITGVLAAGVSYSRLESIAVDMSPDYESLSQAGEALPYQPLNQTGLVRKISRMFRMGSESTPTTQSLESPTGSD